MADRWPKVVKFRKSGRGLKNNFMTVYGFIVVKNLENKRKCGLIWGKKL